MDKTKNAPQAGNTKADISEAPQKKATPVKSKDSVTITLEEPIVYGGGEQVIDKITIRKPSAGDLRGVSLLKLLEVDVDSVAKVLPRVSNPPILDINDIDPADLVALSTAISSFFAGKSVRQEMQTELEKR